MAHGDIRKYTKAERLNFALRELKYMDKIVSVRREVIDGETYAHIEVNTDGAGQFLTNTMRQTPQHFPDVQGDITDTSVTLHIGPETLRALADTLVEWKASDSRL